VALRGRNPRRFRWSPPAGSLPRTPGPQRRQNPQTEESSRDQGPKPAAHGRLSWPPAWFQVGDSTASGRAVRRGFGRFLACECRHCPNYGHFPAFASQGGTAWQSTPWCRREVKYGRGAGRAALGGPLSQYLTDPGQPRSKLARGVRRGRPWSSRSQASAASPAARGRASSPPCSPSSAFWCPTPGPPPSPWSGRPVRIRPSSGTISITAGSPRLIRTWFRLGTGPTVTSPA
jgi:hypothetical protein